jgi:hypothetical protein
MPLTQEQKNQYFQDVTALENKAIDDAALLILEGRDPSTFPQAIAEQAQKKLLQFSVKVTV